MAARGLDAFARAFRTAPVFDGARVSRRSRSAISATSKSLMVRGKDILLEPKEHTNADVFFTRHPGTAKLAQVTVKTVF